MIERTIGKVTMTSTLISLVTLSAFLFIHVETVTNRTFPTHFKFGVATSAYQIEGGWKDDGKGENIWDHVCHSTPSYIADKNNGDIACDSYHKYKEDVALLKHLGVDFYRFSLSWSRILPRGVAGSAINPEGVKYYRNLTQELLNNGIEPMVTIFHWDTPQPVEDLGGWPNVETADHYAYYARVVFEQLGDLVKHWMTFNEPLQTCQQGYGSGTKAPGTKASGVVDYLCGRTLLLAHAKAYHIYDQEFRAKQKGVISIVADTMWFEPATDKKADVEAAERAIQFTYGWFLNPVVHGNWPQVMIDRIDARSKRQGYSISRLPKLTEDEIGYIKGTHDFMTINAYTSTYAADQEEPDLGIVSFETDQNVKTFYGENWGDTITPWFRVVPWGLRRLLNWISKTYNKPEIFVTENGFPDEGQLDDDPRINFHREYLDNLLSAILDDGVNVTRYTVWSLLDTFEWEGGFTNRLGLHFVDFEDPQRPRTAKKSAAYYKNVIATRCLVDACEKN